MKNSKYEKFEQIYREYKDIVFRISFLYLKDYQLAEDASQETFIKVLKKLRSLKDMSKIKPWISAIAVNVCKDKLKSKSRFEILNEKSIINKPVDNEISDDRLTVVEAVKKLDLPFREVVILYYYQELTQKEIARVLNLTPANVAYRLREAKSKLRKYIKEN